MLDGNKIGISNQSNLRKQQLMIALQKEIRLLERNICRVKYKWYTLRLNINQ